MKIKGRVIHGKKEGRALGFPTVNMEFEGDLEDGVYSGRVIVNGKKYKSAVVYRKKTSLLEAHMIGFSGDLYGREIEVEVEKKLRKLINFKSREEIISQIEKDIRIIEEL